MAENDPAKLKELFDANFITQEEYDSRLKSAHEASASWVPTEGTDTPDHKFKIVFTGEAGTGKTELLRAISQNYKKTTVVEESDSKDKYWNRHVLPTTLEEVWNSEEGKSYQISFKEVMGSRGRRSNSYELKKAMKDADLVLYCLSMDKDSNWQARGIKTIRNRMEGKSIPVICVGTKGDIRHATFDSVLNLLKDEFVIETSSVNGQVENVIPAIFHTLFTGVEAMEIDSDLKTEEVEKTNISNPTKNVEKTIEKSQSKRLQGKFWATLTQNQTKTAPVA